MKQTIEIVDQTGLSSTKRKPIELIYCFQIGTQTPQFKDVSPACLMYTTKLVRLGQVWYCNRLWDLVQDYRETQAHPLLWLGHWNDGVVA